MQMPSSFPHPTDRSWSQPSPVQTPAPLPVAQSSQPSQPKLLQSLGDLPLGRKTQLGTLLLFLSLASIVGLGSTALVGSLRSQLLDQTKSQLSVTELNYNAGLESVGLGFASQAQNPLLIEAARAAARKQSPTPEQYEQIRSLLRNEVDLRQIEYATVVGKDGRIIVNANRDRRGQVFNPNNLVSQVLQRPRQVRSSEIVPWSELNQEKPKSVKDLTNQDALIRYTVTPIQDPTNRQVIGALISGDIVNGKPEIVQKTVEAFQGIGYSAIYLNNPNFPIVTSLEKNELRQAKPNLALSDKSLLERAIAAKGQPVAEHSTLNGHPYTLASKAIPNAQGKAVAILVYGDPELGLRRIIDNSLRTQIGLSLGLLGLAVVLAWLLGRAISQPIKKLQKAANAFASGNYQARAVVTSRDEVGQLAANFNDMVDNIETNDRLLRQETEMFRFLAELTVPRRLEKNNLSNLFQDAIAGSRQLIEADRLSIYRFRTEGEGGIVTESFGEGWTSILGSPPPLLTEEAIANFRDAQIELVNNIYNSTFEPEYLHWLEQLQVKSSLILPILNQGKLFGLLIAHQCAYLRTWQETEVNFLKQLVTQLQSVLDRASLHQQRELESRLAQHLKTLTLRISDSFDAGVLFELSVTHSRQALICDRTLVYCFDEHWQGKIIAESVGDRFPVTLGQEILDPCFADRYVQQYREGRVKATDNIYNAGLNECHLKQLEPFGIKANLVAPILVAGELFGLLIAHHCQSPRVWQPSEIDFFTQVSLQVGVALERANLLDRQTLAEAEQRQAKENLQQRALELLMEVDPISRGDLTIHAKVTEDEIGTIADSYNATVENLRRIVTQVKAVTLQLTTTSNSNAIAVDTLTQDALRQVDEIALTLDRLSAMHQSIQVVSHNAEAALQAVQEANETVSSGEIAMNQAVDGMVTIRETVTTSAKKIQHLDESSQKISKVVSLIGRFAAQTHLLALKASIEAARAGEGGRGFAVIAEEVRTLATQSAEATAEIETLVLSIQSETREVAATMQMGTEQVVIGSQLVDETRKSLNRITTVSAQINALVESIVQASAEQSLTSESLTYVITEVAEIAHNTSGSASGVSAAFATLLDVAQDLQTSVNQFKVQS